MQGKEEWYVHSPRATYAHLQGCLATALADQARAKKRHWFRAYHDYSARLAMLDMVLETFGPLMAQHPTMTLAEACGDLPLLPVPAILSPSTDARDWRSKSAPKSAGIMRGGLTDGRHKETINAHIDTTHDDV